MERHSFDLPGARPARRLSYLEAGPAAAAETVLCVHGMTRNARDFEALAAALAERGRRVIAVDVAGRGDSDRLADPAAYHAGTYAADIAALIGHLGAAAVDWVGTSMGGVIGMAVAGAPDAGVRGLVRRLVLNDIGPMVPAAALARIVGYVTAKWRFASLAEAEAAFRETYAPFRLASDAEWRWFTEISVRPDGSGGWVPAYDPAIGDAYRGAEIGDAEYWSLWDAITCPVLVLRGAESDVLTAATAEEMTRRGPCARLVSFAGIGHAPALLAGDQIGAIVDWLDAGR